MMDSASYYLSSRAHEVDQLELKLAACKRALAWAWNNNTDVDAIDWDAFFAAQEEGQ